MLSRDTLYSYREKKLLLYRFPLVASFACLFLTVANHDIPLKILNCLPLTVNLSRVLCLITRITTQVKLEISLFTLPWSLKISPIPNKRTFFSNEKCFVMLKWCAFQLAFPSMNTVALLIYPCESWANKKKEGKEAFFAILENFSRKIFCCGSFVFFSISCILSLRCHSRKEICYCFSQLDNCCFDNIYRNTWSCA